MKRKQIPNKIRFEVFKRDKFTCQYCGRKAPDVVLNVDHINPIAKGGDNNILNLITSCFECNNGKRDIPLGRQEEIEKQRNELEMLEERRNQIDMLFKWKQELSDFKNYEINKINDYLSNNYHVSLSEYGKQEMKKIINKYGIDAVIESIDIAFTKYEDNSFEYIVRICECKLKEKDNPNLKDINYLLKIGKNNISNFKKYTVSKFLKDNYEKEDFETLKYIFVDSFSMNVLMSRLEYYYFVE